MTILDEDLDDGDTLETMPVGAINFGEPENQEFIESVESWREWYPTWKNPQALAREQIENCYEMASECTLTISQPYPGDDLMQKSDCSPHNRFRVTQMSRYPDKFRINDRFNEFEIIVDKSRLVNPQFNLGHWYATKRARELGLSKPSTKKYPASLENPIVEVTRNLLLSGVQSHFPNVRPDTWTELRFFVYLKDYGSTTYVVVDDDLDLKLEIDLSKLENPKFDLIKWYLNHVLTMS